MAAVTNPEKAILALRFLQSLSKIQRNKPFGANPDNDNHHRETRRRVRKIKIAAYSSMARAAGTNKAWSRALLWKLRRKKQTKAAGVRRRSRLKKKLWRWEPKEAGRLRRLVPGGEAMEICSLIEEAADYIKCLSTQVKVMKSIADSLSL